MMHLIEALQSGKYEQNFGAMRSGNKYCCVGLACEIYRQIHPDEFRWSTSSINKKNFVLVDNYNPAYTYSGRMPVKVAKYFNLGNPLGKFETPAEYQIQPGHTNLIHLNDQLKWSFKTLASFLKTNPKFIEAET